MSTRRFCFVETGRAMPSCEMVLRLADRLDVPRTVLQPPLNVLRLSLPPKGLAPRIVNLGRWRAHLPARLRPQVVVSVDPVLAALDG